MLPHEKTFPVKSLIFSIDLEWKGFTIFVFAMIFQLLIQFIHSFAVLCTVARALRGCLPGACIASPLASQNVQRFDVDTIICCTGSVCIMLLVGFQISELRVDKWLSYCCGCSIWFKINLFYCNLFSTFWLNGTNGKLEKKGSHKNIFMKFNNIHNNKQIKLWFMKITKFL